MYECMIHMHTSEIQHVYLTTGLQNKEVKVNEREMLNEWVLVMIGEDRTLLW